MAQVAAVLAPELVRQDPWLALLAFRRLVVHIPGTEAIAARDHGWGLDVWTFVHGSGVETRQALARRQWELMTMYPELDLDFHIVDRQNMPLESFVSPTEYDLFIRVRSS
ncbi:MAG: hypothetical protein ACE5JL_07665 [Dehalococcoidia bacterium]